MQILKISSKNKREALEKSLKTIKEGKVVVCPTDTVYGLIADAKNRSAVRKIFKIKKRSFEKPLPVFVKDLKMAKSIADIGKIQEKILKKVWPGKVTAVLSAKSLRFPKGILSKDKKVGLRMPRHKLLTSLLKELGSPLAETSANISGNKATTKIKDVLREFSKEKHQPDLILDAGNLKNSLPSTVIDLTSLKILRKGQFSEKEILGVLRKYI